MTRSIEVYGDKVYRVKVSEYGLENRYLGYQTLAQILGDCILNNTIRAETLEDWDWLTAILIRRSTRIILSQNMGIDSW